MAQAQAELRLPPPRNIMDESEQACEERLHSVLLRKLHEAVTEIGRKNICYALDIGEDVLSKQLDQKENRKPSYRLLAYCLKYEKSGELARWLMADYAGYLPPERPEKIEPEEAMRAVVALALAGDMGRDAAQKVLAIYERTKVSK